MRLSRQTSRTGEVTTMARKKQLCKAANGLFVRNLGWKRTAAGYAQHKFYLGRDEAKAELASRRLEQLWQEVCERWQREETCRSPEPLGLSSVCVPAAWPTFGEPQAGPFTAKANEQSEEVVAAPCGVGRPVWDEVTLAIAEAVRSGANVARVPLPLPFSAMVAESSLVADWLDRLQDDFTVVKIELREQVAQKMAMGTLETHGRRLMQMGQRMVQKAAGGETLHAALDAYAKWIAAKYVGVEKNVTPWGATQGRQVVFIRRHLPDGRLGDLSARRIDELLEVIRLRPAGEGGRPVSVSWTRNCVKQFRHFLRWLNKRPEFGWKRPADLELEPVRIELTPGEKS